MAAESLPAWWSGENVCEGSVRVLWGDYEMDAMLSW